MKWLILIGCSMLCHLLSGQVNNQKDIFVDSEWKSSERWLGGDTVILVKDHFPDTVGLNSEKKNAVVQDYWMFERIYFDLKGAIKKYHYYVWCSVGEETRKLEHFKLKGNKVTVLMKLIAWGGESYKMETYVYAIKSLERDTMVLVRLNRTKNSRKRMKKTDSSL